MRFYNTCITLVCLLLLITVVRTLTSIPSYGMDDKKVCLSSSVHLVLVEDEKSSLIIGKKTPPNSAAAAKNCIIQFSPSSEKGFAYLRLKFDNFYINDCDITLSITQSATSLFDNEILQLVKLTCEDPSPGVLYASRDYSVRVTLSRDDIYLRNYNFRVNVSLSAVGPPESGPSVAVIIGISTALVALICIIAFIMVKYTRMKNAALRERRAERAIECALRVHNSQELHNGIVYTSVPCAGDSNGALHSDHRDSPRESNECIASQQEDGHSVSKNGHAHSHLHMTHLPASSGLSSSTNTSEDSHVLFEPFNSHSHTHKHRRAKHHHSDAATTETIRDVRSPSEGPDLPPSYEEALEMPKPPESPPESPEYMNVDAL